MTTYNTGNPIGSASPKDLYDNAQNIDSAVNDKGSAVWRDRFGVLRKTWFGIESEANLQIAKATEEANRAEAAAAAIGPLEFYETKAQAAAAAPSLSEGAIVEVAADESKSGHRTRYKVVGGVLTFLTDLDYLANKIASVTPGADGASQVGYNLGKAGTVGTSMHEVEARTPAPEDWGHVINPKTTTYPYNPNIDVDVLRGDKATKFAMALTKTLTFTDTPNFKFNDRMANAIASGVVNVCVLGDSITAGADNWRSNAYFEMLKVKLQQAIPWVKFNFVNYAIGGMSAGTLMVDTYVGAASQADYNVGRNFWYAKNYGGANSNTSLAPAGYALLNEGYWPNGSVPGKTWKQHVVDADADMIVYAFGMNDGTDFDNFLVQYDLFQSFVKAANPSNPPWFTLVSCFLPDMIPPNGQPHATWQLPAQCMADQLKYLAKRDSYGHIDANSIFNLLREGRRDEYAVYTHEANWRYGSEPAAWAFQPGFAFNAGASRAEGIGMALRKVVSRDIDFSASFTVGEFAGNSFVARIGYRGTSETPGTTTGYSADVVLKPTSNYADVTLYYKTQQIATMSFNMGAPSFVGHSISVKVKVTGDHHEIWLAGMLMIDTEDCRSFYRGGVQVGIPQGRGSVQELGLSYMPFNYESPLEVDRKWLLGTPMFNADGSFAMYGDWPYNPDSMGGNVVNHPTAWGHNTYYGFGVARFVEQMKQLVNQPIRGFSESSVVVEFAGEVGVPTKIDTLKPVYVNVRKRTKFKVTICVTYSIGGQVGLAQAGVLVNDNWNASSYLPWSTAIGGQGLRFATISKVIEVAAGKHVLELGFVKSAAAETLRVGEVGTTYSLEAIEL